MCSVERGAGWRQAGAILAVVMLAACGIGDDLWPSGRNRVTPPEPGTVGPGVGQVAPDFTRPDTTGAEHGLYAELATAPGVILYFNMWCPICDAHMQDLRAQAIPSFPDVPVWVVDYVSGSVADSRTAQLQAGWDGAPFTFLVDPGAGLERFYQASMAMVVIGADHVVKYNGSYDWGRLQPILASLRSAP